MKNFVGVFDSGIGGLTVLSELKKYAPNHRYVYLADHAFCPYGVKNPSEIEKRVVDVSEFLVSQGASAIVVACNTASIFAPKIRSRCNVPVFDIVSTTVAALRKNDAKKIALLATNATVKSGVYQRFLSVFGKVTTAFCCSELVPVVENGATSSEKTAAVRHCLKNFSAQDVDVAVLGCTHFPFLKKEISQIARVNILSCSETLSPFFCRAKLSVESNSFAFLTTGDPTSAEGAAFNATDQRFNFSHVDI